MATVGDIAKLQWEMFVVLKLKPVMLGCKGWEGWEGGGRGWRCIKNTVKPNAQPTLVKNSNFCSCLLGARFFPESVLK